MDLAKALSSIRPPHPARPAPPRPPTLIDSRPARGGAEMDATGRDMLRQFVGGLNKGAPHRLDWQRFYDFTIHAHGLERAYRVDEVRAILTEEGLTGEEARRFVYFYEDGLALLRRYDEQAH